MHEIAVHLSFECRLGCQVHDPQGCRILDRHVPPQHSWTEWLPALQTLPTDWLIHFQGGDPLLFPGFPLLVGGLRRPWKVTTPLGDWPAIVALRDGRYGVETCEEFVCSYHHPRWGGTLSPQGYAIRLRALLLSGFPVIIKARPNSAEWPLSITRDLTGLDAKTAKVEVRVEPFEPVEMRFMIKGSEPWDCEGFLQIDPLGDVFPCVQALLGGLQKQGVYRMGNVFEGWVPEWKGMEKCYLRCQQYQRQGRERRY